MDTVLDDIRGGKDLEMGMWGREGKDGYKVSIISSKKNLFLRNEWH